MRVSRRDKGEIKAGRERVRRKTTIISEVLVHE